MRTTSLPLTLFSKRQTEIIYLLVKGHSSLDIAEKLSISRHTVDTHRRAILKKAGCTNTLELLIRLSGKKAL